MTPAAHDETTDPQKVCEKWNKRFWNVMNRGAGAVEPYVTAAEARELMADVQSLTARVEEAEAVKSAALNDLALVTRALEQRNQELASLEAAQRALVATWKQQNDEEDNDDFGRERHCIREYCIEELEALASPRPAQKEKTMDTKTAYELDRETMFLAADGSMMCEKHPGHEWGKCPGGNDCAGSGTPWVLTGRTLIEEVKADV